MDLNKIQILFESKARIIGSVFLLNAFDSIKCIKVCQNKEIEIAGIEGFRIIDEKIQPYQEDSFDFFDLEDQINRYDFALDFLEKRIDSGRWFEIVFGH